jgi:hypothetical protein
MMNPEDMTILVAAIFRAQFLGWSDKTCVKQAKDFVRFAERSLRQDRATRRQLDADAFREVVGGPTPEDRT